MKHSCYYILALFFLFLSGADFCLAKAPIQTNNTNLKIGAYDQTLSQKEKDGLAQEKIDLIYSPKYLSEIENINFCEYKKSILCSLLFDVKNESHIKKVTERTIDEKKLNDFLNDLARKTDKDPENAKLKFEDEKATAFSAGSKGIQLDKEKGFEILKNYLEQNTQATEISLPFKEKDPDISLDSIDNMGISSLIGEGRSNFKGSPKNRIFNIKVAIKRFEGVLIKPKEEFSFVKTLGDVDEDHGYLPELVIKKDKTEPEFGGGICQVSTTAFRAAIYSGLKITARRNHAYPVNYYNPQGMDSTVYVPKPDLKFVNNTSGYILIQPKIEGTELIFDFYGTSDGRKTEVIGPKITERNPDGSMKATFTQKVLDTNENVLLEDVFNSSYDSPDKYPHPGQVLTEKPDEWSQKQWKEYKKTTKTP